MAQLQRITLEPNQTLGETLHLMPAQHHYLYRVLRLKPGDRFLVLNGQGQQWLATLTDADSVAHITDLITPNPTASAPSASGSMQSPPVILLAALPKGNGFDEVVRQSTEIGVQQIVPIISDRTLLRPSAQKLNRWQRIATEAAEQSERLVVPDISSPVPFAQGLQQGNPRKVGVICVARWPSTSPRELPQPISLSHALTQHDWQRPLAIAIGPEGGWTGAEIEAAIAADYSPITLGHAILRAVTAPLVALTLVNAAWEER